MTHPVLRRIVEGIMQGRRAAEFQWKKTLYRCGSARDVYARARKAAFFCFVIAFGATCHAEDTITPEQVRDSLDRSVAYLISRQHESGCFADEADRHKGKLDQWKEDVRRRRYQPPRHSTGADVAIDTQSRRPRSPARRSHRRRSCDGARDRLHP